MSDALNNMHKAYIKVLEATQRARDELREVVRTKGDRTSLNIYMAEKRDAEEHLERLLVYNAGALITVALFAGKAMAIRNGAKGDLTQALDAVEGTLKHITCPLADAIVGYMEAVKDPSPDESWAIAALATKQAAKKRMRKRQTVPAYKDKK